MEWADGDLDNGPAQLLQGEVPRGPWRVSSACLFAVCVSSSYVVGLLSGEGIEVTS